MPCNGEYMNPNEAEENSKEAAELIVYAFGEMNMVAPPWVIDASRSYYGKPSRLHDLVRMLCDTCKFMTNDEQDRIIYNGRSARARRLASWWEKHLKADVIRENKEAEEIERKRAEEKARNVLTKRERELLGLK